MRAILFSLIFLMNYSIFAQTRDPRSKDQANVFWNGEYPLYSLTSDKQILPNGSGEFIFWGTTNEKPEPTEYKLTKGQTKYVYKFIDYQECILFCNEIRKGKGMQLLEISSIPNRIRWEAKGKTIIEKNLNQEWLESSNGNTFIYNQISSDERGILLQDKNRNGVFIYLENDKCHYKDLNTDWVIIYYGNWIGNSYLCHPNLLKGPKGSSQGGRQIRGGFNGQTFVETERQSQQGVGSQIRPQINKPSVRIGRKNPIFGVRKQIGAKMKKPIP